MIRPIAASLCLLAVSLVAGAAEADAELTTVAERSSFRDTGRYEEVIALCGAFAARWPDQVRCQEFGSTPEGRPMQLLVVSADGVFTPQQAQERKRPVTLVQGGIHAGEIDGKDAGFLVLRELLEGRVAKGALQQQVLLFVPVFNVDGHERFGAWNRPNQRGPREMGWRTTAQNYNLNRDYAKADTPEMQAMLALLAAWDPLLVVDLHVTDGAKFEHDISIQVEPVHAGDEALRGAGHALKDAVIAALADNGSLPLPFYPSFVIGDDPASGFADGVAPPRFSHGYFHLRNRIGMLVETHSWRPYPHRVRSTHDAVVAVLQQVAQHGAEWRALALAADARAAQLAGTPVPLAYAATDKAREIEFRGYAYTRTPSEVSGALMTRYDEQTPQVWKIPLRDEVLPSIRVTAPAAGYFVPAAHAGWVAPHLQRHGIAFERLERPLHDAPVQAFRASRSTFGATPVEGHQMLTVEGDWGDERHDLRAGALYVPIAQPRARLLMALLEPEAPDSLLAWGEFNNAFERKEYMEDYVAEDVARAMLSADPALKAAFERRVRDDATFAGSPSARLDFFYRRHSSWDAQHNLYPVLRATAPPR